MLDESPRWLVQQGRYEEAERVLRKGARINNVEVPSYFGSMFKNHMDNVRYPSIELYH